MDEEAQEWLEHFFSKYPELNNIVGHEILYEIIMDHGILPDEELADRAMNMLKNKLIYMGLLKPETKLELETVDESIDGI